MMYRFILSQRENLLLIGVLIDWLKRNDNEEVADIAHYLCSEFNTQYGLLHKTEAGTVKDLEEFLASFMPVKKSA